MEVKSKGFEKFKVQIAEKLKREAQGQAQRMRLGPRSQDSSGAWERDGGGHLGEAESTEWQLEPGQG